ncbi:MAG: AI-2E family transporter [Spirochaetes bacterium]|jgi:predicted PurR-regulated permease PerM|nr:AI-2E family transporter [Spirochaetota bacterium]
MIEKTDSYRSLQQNKKLKYLFLALFSLLLFSMAYIFQYYFWPLLFALVIYIALSPLHVFIGRFVKRRSLSASIMILLLIVGFLVPLFFLLLNLADQSYDVYQFVEKKFKPSKIDDFFYRSNFVGEFAYSLRISRGELIKKATEILQSASFSVFRNLTDLLTFSIKFSINLFFMLLILFFLFIEGGKFKEAIYRASPFPRDIENDIANRLKDVIKVLIAGNLLIMLLQGGMVGLGFYIAGLDGPLLWGSVAAVFSLIPVIGTSVTWIPATVYLLAVGKIGWAVFLFVWGLFWYLLLENMLKPKVFGERLNFHPLIFFFLLLGSLQAFGLSGIIVGPMLLTLFYSFLEIYRVLDAYDIRQAAQGCAGQDADAPRTGP